VRAVRASLHPCRPRPLPPLHRRLRVLRAEGRLRDRDEIDRVVGAIKATHPDFRYQPIAPAEELGGTGRIQWIKGSVRSCRVGLYIASRGVARLRARPPKF
jgi:hypothetical protein